ncbi:MAG: N-acylglucosamine 2-epimerase [Rhodopirellula sp.]|nr:N-acylglucosamine 2-epimerase [Rhodopirellula sp.]OUX50779.1 MAG: N-acylglucosamine 2-epimerase [Rhodopirellula sp. TMED283]
MSHLNSQELAAIYRNGLMEDTMPFWEKHCVDHQHGGFMMAVDQTGKVVDTDKGVWQQGRFTWLLGELYNNVEARDVWLDLARHGADFLLQHCFDASDGRMWFHVTRDGKPIRKRRYAFSESFAAIAFGELAKATGEKHYAEHAVKAFHSFVQHNLEPIDTPPKFTDHRQMRSIGFPMITIATAQELRESICFADANLWIDRSIETIQRFHHKPELNCVMETVGMKGELIDHFDGRTLNPGHAIEGAWFLMWEGAHRNDSALIESGCQMLDWMWQRGWDSEYGGILYFTDVHGYPVQEYWHDMKFWWPQCEAIIATLLAFQLTGRQKYADWHQKVHQWAYQHFPDSDHGEWFGYLDRTGRVTSTLKGNLWKGPFHLPRMQHICTTILSL